MNVARDSLERVVTRMRLLNKSCGFGTSFFKNFGIIFVHEHDRQITRFTQNNKSSGGARFLKVPGVQVQDSRRDVYLVLSTSSTCQLILLVAVDLIASQLVSSRCLLTVYLPFLSVLVLVHLPYLQGNGPQIHFLCYKLACLEFTNVLSIKYFFLTFKSIILLNMCAI